MEEKQINNNIPENPKKKSHKKLISNLIFLTLLTVLVVILLLSMGEINKIGESLSHIGQNYIWLIAAIGLVLAYFILWPFSQCIYGKALKIKASFGESFLIGSSEHFYNGITPFAAGGQPFQIYSYTKRKVTTAQATGVILASFVTFMMVTNAFAIVSLFFWQDIWNGLTTLNMQWVIWVALVGFIINFSVLLFMIALGTNKHIRNVLVKLLTKLANWKIFHNEKHKLLNRFGNFLVNQIPNFELYCSNAQVAFKQVWSHKLATVLAIIIKIICMGCYYAIPFFLLKAVGIDIGFDKIPLVLFATSFAITSVVWMPTPGGTGGIEFAFQFVIAAVIGMSVKEDATAVCLLWRLVTFYLVIIISFILNAVFEAIASKRMKKEEQNV
ncbi:MAG: flippase-like domain-containing protein [Bacilli bacterium]|nr:flippase-like domain-containing protein [Bacilli bacterium]